MIKKILYKQHITRRSWPYQGENMLDFNEMPIMFTLY